MSEESERRQQILDAAFEEFSHKGFTSATIKSIARAAGLQSPSLIYWYFPTKEDLFQAVVEARAPFFQMTANPMPLLDRRPEEVLPLLGQAYLSGVQKHDNQKLARLLLTEAIRRPEIANMVSERLLLRVLGLLKHYLARQIEMGRLRPHDVRSSARAFIGMLIPIGLSLLIFPAMQADDLSSEEHLRQSVAIFLDGLRPAPGGETAE